MFNGDKINRMIYDNGLTQINSIYFNASLAYPDPLTKLSRFNTRDNVSQALSFIDQSALNLTDGVIVNPDNEPVSLTLLLTRPSEEKLALHYQKWLRRIGINLIVRTVDNAQYLRHLQAFDFDLAIAEWRNSLSPGAEQYQYWGTQAAEQSGSFNYAGVQSEEIDHAIQKLIHAKSYDRLREAAHDIDREFMKGYYGIPLFANTKDYFIVNRNIASPDNHALYGAIVETWWQNNL